MRTARTLAAMLATLILLSLPAAPLATASGSTRQSSRTTVTLERDGCVFTATAAWTRTDVTHVTLHLIRKTKTGSTASNGQLVAVASGATTASATWHASSVGVTNSFSAQVNLYNGEPFRNDIESTWLGSASTTKSLKATCDITAN